MQLISSPLLPFFKKVGEQAITDWSFPISEVTVIFTTDILGDQGNKRK